MALSLLLSYFETLLPSFIPVPGVKLGLANTAVLFALYTLGLSDAFFITVIRVLISSMMFSNILTLSYSLAGAVMSLVFMAVAKKMKAGVIAVSMTGAIVHNVSQLLCAMLMLGSSVLLWYLPFLILAGSISGLFTGSLSSVVLQRLETV